MALKGQKDGCFIIHVNKQYTHIQEGKNFLIDKRET